MLASHMLPDACENIGAEMDCTPLPSPDRRAAMDTDEPRWKEIARRVEEERDPEKMLQLCRELDEAMLEEQRLKLRTRLEQKRRPAA